MHRKAKIFLLFLICVIGMLWVSKSRNSHAQQAVEKAYKDNNCVNCHSQLIEPLLVSGKFLEWQLTDHEAKGVSCEKCHGGDPATNDKKKAHAGVLPPSDPKSRLHWKNQPETCNSCHQEVVTAFTQSTHYQRLKGIGLGPSCNSCHAHMATRVIYAPSETADLCARCHDSVNFIQPRPDLPIRARDTMTALQRADMMISWAQLLIAEGQKRGWSLTAEQEDLKRSEEILHEARVKWHIFNLEDVRKQADDAYVKGAKVKDGLRKKLMSD